MSTPTAAVFGHPSYAQMDELIDAVEALTSIDNAMSSTSEHPVQNKAIKAYVDSNVDEMNTAISELEDAVSDAVSDILGNFAHYESTSTASQAYAIGEHLTYNGYLYRVTTAIAQGGTITVGTNVVQTNVGAEIANSRLWFKNVPVSAITGSIINLSDSRITSDYVLEGNSITWGDSSKITSLTNWSTETAGHFIVTGTCTAATTATFALVKADQRIENS